LEAVAVAEKIAELHKSTVPLHEIAVLYRNHADAADLMVTLEKWNIPYQ
jgi:superfamily I DNA/RNA helicase